MKAGRQVPTWAVLLLAVVGLVLVIPGVWVFVSLTAKPIHPNAESVPTVAGLASSPRFAGTVEKARRMVRADVADQNLPGISVALGIGGDLVWAEGFGYGDLKSSTLVTPGHQFRIGTASAALTSAAAGLLLEKGRLQLDDEIQKYVPAFPRKESPVTLRGLMAHTSGVLGDADGGSLFTKHCQGTEEALRYFADARLQYPPGTQYRYSNYDWILVSTAIEAAAAQPFLTFMREQIFDRVGMRDTIPDSARLEAGEDFPLVNLVRELIHDPEATRSSRPDFSRKPVANRVTPYFTRFASDPKYGVHVMRPLDYSCYAGSGVFVSTPSDLVRFGMALNSGKLLQPATVELLQTSQKLTSGEETGYGLGWYVKTFTLAGKPTRVTGTDGDSLGGTVASLMTVPEHGITVAVTSNVSHADTFSLAVRLAESFVEHAKSPVSR